MNFVRRSGRSQAVSEVGTMMAGLRSFTEAGGHAKNEDAFEAQCHPEDPLCLICLLADGQGGRHGGARAAQVACQAGMAEATRFSSKDLLRPGAWVAILRSADKAVSADRDAGFTTLLGFCSVQGAICGASSGDSAVLAIHKGGHAEELTAGQEKNPPVGSGAATLIPFATKLVSPWKILAMSDGVWKYVGLDRVRETGAKLHGQALLDELQRQARLPGSGRFQDDFTIVLVEETSWARE